MVRDFKIVFADSGNSMEAEDIQFRGRDVVVGLLSQAMDQFPKGAPDYRVRISEAEVSISWQEGNSLETFAQIAVGSHFGNLRITRKRLTKLDAERFLNDPRYRGGFVITRQDSLVDEIRDLQRPTVVLFRKLTDQVSNSEEVAMERAAMCFASAWLGLHAGERS